MSKRILCFIIAIAIFISQYTLSIAAEDVGEIIEKEENEDTEEIPQQIEDKESSSYIFLGGSADGSTVQNAINIKFGNIYSKNWLSGYNNRDQNVIFLRVFVPARGIIKITASKPTNSNLRYSIYDQSYTLFWQNGHYQSSNNISNNYSMSIGLASGTYYIKIEPTATSVNDSVSTYCIDFEENEYCEIEPNESLSEATPMTTNQMYKGFYGRDGALSNEYWSCNLDSTKTYRLKIGNYRYFENARSLIFKVYDPSGAEFNVEGPNNDRKYIKNFIDENGNNYVDFNVTISGKYIFCISNYMHEQFLYTLGLYEIEKEPEPISVTGISLDTQKIELSVGNTVQLHASVFPDNATNKSIEWSSYNSGIATVDNNGLVEGISPGSVYIYAKTKDKNKEASCLVQVKAQDPVVNFVKRMYNVALEREPDQEGLNNWVNSLKDGSKKGADIAQGFYLSPEMLGKGLSNEDYVESAYKGIMGRASDQEGKSNWIEALQCGVTYNAIVKGFVGSQEFNNLCAEYGITAGDIVVTENRDKNVGVTKFVSRLYTQALGRGFDIDGLNDWCGQIIANPSRDNILNISTNGFFHSSEFLNKNLSNAEFVTVLYHTYLGREPDASGFADWVGQLDNGEKTRDQVMEGFAYSNEFGNIIASYGL